MEYCIEDWSIFGLEHGRAIFSGLTMLVQYVMPISIVTISYSRICKNLKRRMEEKTQATQIERTREKAERNFRRTNKLLISVSLIFGLSWLPLNLLNTFADLSGSSFGNLKSFLITFALCHMVGMSSACSNPLLYGWLNDTFRKEFKEVFAWLWCRKGPNNNESPEAGFKRKHRNSYEQTETQLIPAALGAGTATVVALAGLDGAEKPNNNDCGESMATKKRETIVCLT